MKTETVCCRWKVRLKNQAEAFLGMDYAAPGNYSGRVPLSRVAEIHSYETRAGQDGKHTIVRIGMYGLVPMEAGGVWAGKKFHISVEPHSPHWQAATRALAQMRIVNFALALVFRISRALGTLGV